MGDIVQTHNIAAYLNPVNAYYPKALTASGNSGSTLTGQAINRNATPGLYRSMDVVGLCRSSGSSKYKIKVRFKVKDSANNSSFSVYGSASNSTFSFGSTTATAKQSLSSLAALGVDLGSARAYVRVDTVITWSGTNKSTPATYAAIAVLGGSDLVT